MQGGQGAIGTLRLDLLIEDMSSSVLLHVIDAKTSYNILLGRPWIHDNGVVPSTLHQCFKYSRDGMVKKVCADDKPFTEAEAYIADAKYYIRKNDESPKVPPSTEKKVQNPRRVRIEMTRLSHKMLPHLKRDSSFFVDFGT